MTLNIPHQPFGGSLSLNTGHRPQLSRGSPPTSACLLPCSVLGRTRALPFVRLEQEEGERNGQSSGLNEFCLPGGGLQPLEL